MRRFLVILSVSFVALLLVGPLSAADTTRTVRAELPESASERFGIENLAGSIIVRPGSGSRVVAVATVHAESAELAETIRIEQVDGEHGRPVLRVIYPLDEHRTIRYPGGSASIGHRGGFLARLFGGYDQTRTRYDGRKVTVSNSGGVLLYADVVVEIPARSVDAYFSNVAGPLRASEVEGKLDFSTGAGDVRLESVHGEIAIDTGSGDVKVEEGNGRISVDTGSGDVTISRSEGRISCDTGSGNCTIREFRGEAISADTGSGDIIIRSAEVDRISVDTGSGDINLVDCDIEQLDADTGSGDINLAARGDRLSRIIADTGSGDVSLRLGPHASFEVRASQGSGDLVNRYRDARPIIEDREVIGYIRGDARIRITVDTGSGDVLIEPGPAAA